jgi:hypothetical protein
LNGVPQSEDWDLEIRLITAQMKVLGKDHKEVIKKLCDREDSIKNSKGIPSEVALYTKSGGFATGSKSSKKDIDKSDAKKDKKDKKEKPVCTYCENKGYLEEKCWAKHGMPDSKDKEDKDKKSATANLTTTSASDTLWMAHADGDLQVEIDPSRDVFLDCACSRHVMNTKTLSSTLKSQPISFPREE